MINTVLSGLTGTRCFVFLDGIVIYARSLAEHDAKPRPVFGRQRKYNLKLQPDKCHPMGIRGSFPRGKISGARS
jgi:hypothetical protein